MDYYNQMILRSYLDKPEVYTPSNHRPQACQEMKLLTPHLERLELHEYPKEHVLVLEGNNLWFSFKIIIDEGGQNHYELQKPHNITKCSLQFNFNPSSKVSAAIQDGESVKVTVHTHFVTKVANSVECKKV